MDGLSPVWDERQRAVIEAQIEARVLVVAGPGEGKTAVACARIAHLIREGLAPTRILLISFTRTAVAELRTRIGGYLGDPRSAAEVQLSTIDAHAWQLRQGFDAALIPAALRSLSFDASIAAVTELLRSRDPALLDYLDRLEHILLDEAQDVVGKRAELIWELVKTLPSSCGVTVFADPAQAIYGFTEDDPDVSPYAVELTERLKTEAKPEFRELRLGTLYRVSQPAMRSLFQGCREVTLAARPGPNHLAKVHDVIEVHASKNMGRLTHEELAAWCRDAASDALVLFRHRVDALCVSSYCAKLGVKHRLRISGAPTIIHPWIGAALWQARGARVTRAQWEDLWKERCECFPGVTRGDNVEAAWEIVSRFARGRGGGDSVDLDQLRAIASRPRPPTELCLPDWGWDGPTLGTIHASKGRESARVALVLFDSPESESTDEASRKRPKTITLAARNQERARQLGEGRVMYVGATRAKEALYVARGRSASGFRLSSGRTCRYTRMHGLMQIEVGRDGDVERVEHLTWAGAEENQRRLAKLAESGAELHGRSQEAWEYRLRLFMRGDESPLGQLTPQVTEDRNSQWKKGTLPGDLQGFYLVGVTTIALRDDERTLVPDPFRSSGFALAPVVRGFAFQKFFPRKDR
ncbi:MAG: UvrD-helicase domain-containing protein [Kofleriaceae bacterium]